MKQKSGRVRSGAVTGAGAIVLFVACGAPNEDAAAGLSTNDVGVVREAVMGGMDFAGDSTCTDDDKAVFRQAMILGRTMTQSPALAQCVDRVMRTGDTGPFLTMGPYHFCSGDQWGGSSLSTQISKVQALLKTNNSVLITKCSGTGGGCTEGVDVHNYSYSETEKFTEGNIDLASIRSVSYEPILADSLAEWRVQQLVRTTQSVWHESMHTHGYHDGEDECGNGTNAMLRSVSYMVEHCVEQVAKQSGAQCDMLDCPKSGYIKLINAYPVTATTACACYREPNTVPATATELLPTLVQDVNEAEDLFGFSLASGDFNKDGFDDLAVGAPGENNDKGAVYLYYGSAFGLGPAQREGTVGLQYPGQIVDGPTLISSGGVAGDLFGRALVAADFNQDGVTDLAIGAPRKDGKGAVFVYRGSRDGLVIAAQFAVNSPSAEFGFSLAAGTFRSGGPSLAVGAPGAGSRGAVYVYQGQANNQTTPLVFWSTLQPVLDAGARFGASVAIGPSAKSIGALAVGAPNYPNGGRVFVYDGSIPANGSFSYSVGSPNQEVQAFGSAVALGSLGGEGNSLAVGAPFHSNASIGWLGAVHYFTDNRSSSGGSVTLHYTQEGPSSGALFGWSMSNPDSNDFLVGAPGESGGRVHQYRNGTVGGQFRAIEQRVFSQTGRGTNETDDTFGIGLAVGDFDGNDFDDIAIGATGEAPGSDPASGAVFIKRRTEDGTWVAGAVVTQED